MAYLKGKRWFSDWRNEHGQRRRKSHPSRKAAERHEAKMQREAHAKKARGRKPLAKRRPSSSKHTPTAPPTKGQKHTSQRSSGS